MHCSYLCEIYIHILSVLFVCCQGFSHQNHQNPYNRRIIRGNNEHSHKQQLSQQNAMFAGRAHPRPNTIGFDDTTQRPPETRPPSRESTSHARQQMPYQSTDPHLRPTNARQQLMSHMSHGRQDFNEIPFHLPPKYMQNSKQFGGPIHPEIIQNPRHLRIQSPHEREEEYDDHQSIDHNNRHSRNNPNGMGSPGFGFNDHNYNVNEGPPQQFPPFSHRRNFNQDRSSFYPSPEQSAMKVVLPRHKDKEETRVQGFETFSTKHDHQEFDKIYPKPNKNSHDFHSFNEMPSEEPSEEPPDYGNVPENEAKLQRDLNLFPPVNAEEEIRRFNEPFQSPHQQLRSNRHQIPDYFGNQFRKPEPNRFYSAQNQQNQNKANHQNMENFQQSIQHSPPFGSIGDGPNGQTFYSDNNPNGFDSRRTNVNKQKNRFQQFYGNDFQRQTTQKPHQMHNTYGRPVKKEIEIVREITEILPSDEEQNNSEMNFDPSPIATPSPPDPPNDYFPFGEERDEKPDEKAKEEEKPGIELGKEENFYDDDEERQLLEQKNKDSMDNDEDDDEKKKAKSKFEKEVDLSADDLENYFDKEFANENEEEKEAQKKIEFDDEPKESNPLVSKKEKSEEPEDTDIEADYKSATDFLKNHDDFLNKIEKENEKFRKRTEDKVEKEEDEETDTETEQKPNVDDGEKDLDADTGKKEAEEETEDKDKTDQKTNKEDKGATEEEEANDSNEETKDKKETEAEDDDESESKEVTEKDDQKSSDNNEDNQQKDEKNEEQEEDNAKDEEKTDNTESDETNESNDEKETKSDKCLESNCDKELLKEESKESKNTQELKSKQGKVGKEGVEEVENEEQVVEQQNTSKESSSIETKPIEGKPNRSPRISQTHNFAPFFIDLKRINPNKSNTRNGSQNNESPTSWTTSATTTPASSSSPKQRNSSIHSVSPPPESRDANKTNDNNKTIETRRVVNSIKDIIKSQNHR